MRAEEPRPRLWPLFGSVALLGLGLDVYGNFAQTDSSTANGCGQNSAPPRTPNAITVRGPGDGTTGYCGVYKALDIDTNK